MILFLVLAVVAFFASCTNDEQGLGLKSTTELLSVLTFSEIKDSIMHFESCVLSNDKLTEVEKEDLLKSTSTFRYSALQWERFVKEHESKLATRSGKKWYHWVVIAGADAIGALVDKTVSGAVLASQAVSDEITKDLSKVEEPKVEESKPEVDSENLE